ncbi:MAG TPA: metallopeptidase TldD-related protein, partial [Candidatus Micrarchaeota archaeon]|nr:metallopeptidase TldD-related protein [Candidatus Micrarchaeota archaeon]
STSGGSMSAFMQTKFNDNSAYAAYSSQNVADFASGSVAEGEKSSLLAREVSGAGALESGKYDIVFELPALHSMISEILLPSFGGDSLVQKTSLLSGKAGKQEFSPDFSLYDDPSDNRGFFSPFDGEGVSQPKKPLVKGGIVSGFLLDSRTACLLGGKGALGEIGNCSRSSFQSMPGCGESTLVVEMPGKDASLPDGGHLEV